MKIEFGLSVLSKRETLLGIDICQRNGVSINGNELCEEHLTEFRFGFVFVIITIAFAKLGGPIGNTDKTGKMIKAMKAFESEMSENDINNNNNDE